MPAPVVEPELVTAPAPAEAVVAPAPEPAVPANADPAYPDAWRNTAEKITNAHPSALSHVELIERLAMALQQRQAAGGELGPMPAMPEMAPAPAPAEVVAPAEAEHGGPDSAATIQALRDALSTLRST